MSKDKQNQGVDNEGVVDEASLKGQNGPSETENPAPDSVTEETDQSDGGTEKMAAEIAQWRDKYIRLSAEFDNYRKRTLKEKMDMVSSASEEVIKALLPVIDDLERALEATESSCNVEAVREGVVLISNKLRDTLHSKGLMEIEALGKELDTDFHEAVAKIPADKKQRGKIVDVVQKGYKLHDKVIRHCKVVVGE